MKILHVIARMNVGGTATYLGNLINGLEEANVDTLLAVGWVSSNEIEDSRVENINNVRIHHMYREINVYHDFLARREIKRVIEKFQPDIIHTHTFKAGLLIRSLKTRIPLVHTFHGHHLYDPDYGEFKKFILNSIERSLARKNAQIVTIGKRVGRELLEQGIGNVNQSVSIPPGISRPINCSRSTILKALDLDNGQLNVLWMGRLTKVKRPERVVEVARAFPSVNFIVAGSGELMAEMKSQAPVNLHLVGVRSASEMWSIADISLLTSDSEGMPLTLIEAQMVGVPGVATEVGSVSEIIIDGETGLLASANIADLKSKLGILIQEGMLRHTMSEKAKIRAEKLFSVENMVDSHLRVYKSILGIE